MSVQANQIGSSTGRALVKQISNQHSYLGEEVLSQMDPDIQQEVKEALLKKDIIIRSSVIMYTKFLIDSSYFLQVCQTSVLQRIAPLTSSSNFFRTLTTTYIIL
jgi:hypothetical protein